MRENRRLAADAGAGAAADRGGGGPISKGASSAAAGCGCRVAAAAASPGPAPDVGVHPGRGPRPAGAVLAFCGPALCKTWACIQEEEARDQLVGGLSVSTTTMSSQALPQTSLACACPDTHWPARAGQAAVCGSAQLGALSCSRVAFLRDASALFSAHGTRVASPILTTQKPDLSLAGFAHSYVLMQTPGGPGVPLPHSQKHTTIHRSNLGLARCCLRTEAGAVGGGLRLYFICAKARAGGTGMTVNASVPIHVLHLSLHRSWSRRWRASCTPMC